MIDPPTGGVPPVPAMPFRPPRRLSPLAMLRTAATNTLSICDQEVFDEPVVVRRYGPVPVAFVSDPAGVRRVLVDRFEHYPRLPLIRRLYAAEIGTGTLAASGEAWARHRRVAAPTLDRRALAPHIPGLIAAAEAAAERFGEGAAPVDIEGKAARLWLDLLNLLVSGGDPRAAPILAWLGKVPRKPRALDLLPMPGWLRERVSPARQSPERAVLRRRLLALMDERRAPAYDGPRDFLWRMAHGTDRDTGATLSPEEARDEASSQLAAGEASVRALTWIWYLLALHPDVEERLHAEIDAVVGARPLEEGHLRSLVYTRQVLDETFRLYPPIPLIVRQARQADVLCGRRVPRRAVVIVSPYVIHRHNLLWRAPDLFDPGRFAPGAEAARARFAFIPFSAGPGMCTGASFAATQLMIAVAVLARRWRFRLASADPVRPFGGISLQPRGGLWMTVERRGARGS